MNDPQQNERRRQERADLVDAFTRGAWQPSVQPQIGPKMLAGGIVLIVVAGAAFGAGALTSYDHKHAAEERTRELALTSRYRSVDPSGRPGATTVPGVQRRPAGTPHKDAPHKGASRPEAPGGPRPGERRTEPMPTPTASSGSPALAAPLKAPDGGGGDGEKGSGQVAVQRKAVERSSQQGGETAPYVVPDLPAPAGTPAPAAAKPDRSEWPTIRTGPPPTAPPAGGTRSARHDAYSPIQAETLDQQSNLGTENTGDVGGGQNLAWIGDGDWALYKGVGFGLDGAHRFYGRVASGAGFGGRVEVRLDSLSNAPVGGFAIGNTGGWQTYGTVEADITEVAGVHDVYLRFISGQPGDFVNLHWFDFGR